MKSQYILPITIVVAGLLIAGAVFWVGKSGTIAPNTTNGQQQNITFPPVTSADHILGNPNAPVKVIEYADLECPYCKVFETTMHQVMDYYGQSGRVAWVYRPFPLAQIHSKAPQEAEAAECAADQGGSTAFFNYIDKLYAITPSENGLDLAQLPVIAGDVGLNVTQFNTCLSSGKYASKVQQSYNDAIAAGGTGTPYILITVQGSKDAVPLEGAQPYDSMRAAIDAVLSTIPGGSATTASSTPAATPTAPAATQ
ncbi:MAG: thioredoxin domain-containing protein [Patescibacteria group bacterium]|nr:thioredoxin domain-containing protein [Patescibacteria group bacterium]